MSPTYDDCLNKCLDYDDGGLSECRFFTHDYGFPGGNCYLYTNCPGDDFDGSCATCITGKFDCAVISISWFGGL